MNNIFTYIILALLVLLIFILKAECYEYDNLGMHTITNQIVGIREYNGKFYLFIIDKTTNKGYAKECMDFHEAFTIQQRLLEINRSF